MKKTIEKLFAEILKKIGDKDLRKKCVATWVNAAAEGGWEPDDLAQIPFTLLAETKGITLIEHTLAVTKGAAYLGKAMEETYPRMPFAINWDYLYAGGLLHDVGKLKEYERVDGKFRTSHNGRCTRHPFSGAILAAKAGLPDDVVNIIANHAGEGEGKPQRVETVLIHQADFANFNPLVMMGKGLIIGQ